MCYKIRKCPRCDKDYKLEKGYNLFRIWEDEIEKFDLNKIIK